LTLTIICGRVDVLGSQNMARALIADLCDTALFSEYLDPTAEDVVATSEEPLPVRWRFFQPRVGQQPSKVCRSRLVCGLITHQKTRLLNDDQCPCACWIHRQCRLSRPQHKNCGYHALLNALASLVAAGHHVAQEVCGYVGIVCTPVMIHATCPTLIPLRHVCRAFWRRPAARRRCVGSQTPLACCPTLPYPSTRQSALGGRVWLAGPCLSQVP
jgi:hypothetical protein